MQRRKFLALSGASAIPLVAGCLGSDDDGTQSTQLEIPEDGKVTSMGESIEYGGLKVTMDDPVLFDHYGLYSCSRARVFEDYDGIQCTPPGEDDFVDPPTQGGHFMALRVTIEHVGQRRISYPLESESFDLINDGYAEEHHLFEDPWVAAANVFPSWVFFVEGYDLHEQGVFPGVSVRGYISFEVPIESDLDEYTGVVRWAGNEDEEETGYWSVSADDVDELTDGLPPELGGDNMYEPRAGGVDWGEAGHPEGEDFEPEGGVRWEFDGDGEYHVPEDYEGEEEEDDEEE